MKYLITIVTISVVSLLCYFAVAWIAPPSMAPQAELEISRISAESTCPVAGCTTPDCHAAAEPSTPNGTFTMSCPDTGCISSECHAWDALTGHYHNPNSLSLDVWIVFPTVLLIALIVFVKRTGKGDDVQ